MGEERWHGSHCKAVGSEVIGDGARTRCSVRMSVLKGAGDERNLVKAHIVHQ